MIRIRQIMEDLQKKEEIDWLLKIILLFILILIHFSSVRAQSGGWDAFNTSGSTGYFDHGNGVIQLLNTVNTGCAGAAVHETSDKYDPCSGLTFSKCYQVFFGCPGDDQIGSDTKGDGLAFSFSKCGYNINNGACGGGLGYHGACGQMITIEFDTWSSQGNSGFDGAYGGGSSGANDEVAIHRDGIASDAGRIVSANAGNLEDGLEHTVCISYNPSTRIMSILIDGNAVLSYDFTGSPYELQTYFGCGGLNQTWSSGKFGATNPATVSNGSDISDNVGGPLCPAGIVIASPSGNTSFGSCEGPFTISAAATPPAGNTVSYVEFFVNGESAGIDNSDPYSINWNSPGIGNYNLTAVAHYVPSGTTSSSAPVTITIGGGIERTSSPPVIDGTIDAMWGNYYPSSLDKVPWGSISGSSDASATYRSMRDTNYLYILVDITDDDLINDGGDPWDNDGVEIFIDMGNDKNSSYGANDFQFAFLYNSASVIEYKHNATAGVSFAYVVKAGGYIMEIRIPWSTLGGAPADGELIGFDVHVNDDDGGGTRDGKIAWNDAIDIAYFNPSGFGTVKASHCNPCPTGILTGDNTVCDNFSTSPLTINFTGTGPWSFTYSIDGITQPAVNGINSSPYVFQSQTGNHVYELLTVSNSFAAGCSGNATGTATITLSSNIPSAVLTGDNTLCDDISTSPLIVSFAGPGPWSFVYLMDGVAQPEISGVNSSPYVFQSAAGTHTYALISVNNGYTLSSGCIGNVSGTASIVVSNNIPVAHDGTFTVPGTAVLTVDDEDAMYEWYDAPVGGNLLYTGTVFTTPVLNDTTSYYVQEAGGAPCRVEVKAIPVEQPSDFFIPNLVTPNNDGRNDHFGISGLPSGSGLKIYNRWGDNVYYSSDYDNLWTGSNEPDGIYYYDLMLPDGKNFKGWVNIVR